MSSIRRLFPLTAAAAASAWLLPHSGAVPQSAGPPAAAVAPSAAAASGSVHSALLQSADELVREVANLRGLPPKTTIARGVLSREQIVEKQRARIAKHLTPEDIRREAGVLKRMGLLPPDMNYEKTVFELFADQVAGFYDPPTRTLYIADWLPVHMQRPALAHEIQHALQDQYFDLQKFSAPMKEEGDASLARSAVVEGDGIAVMLELPAKGARPDAARSPAVLAKLGKQMMYLTMGATPSFQKAPAALRETLVFPYASGLEFVGTYRSEGGWAQINELFRDPPDSTEQIMHPEKYTSRERPVRITAAPLSTLIAGGRKEVRRDVMGELMWKIWFSSAMAQSQAETAAAGWGGDRWVAYEGPGDEQPLVLSLSAWDNDSDADEAEQAMRRVLGDLTSPRATAGPAPKKDGSSKSGPGSGSKDSKAAPSSAAAKGPRSGPFTVYKGSQSYGLVRRERLIALFLGVPKGSETAVTEEMFRGFRVSWPGPTTALPAPAAVPAPTAPTPAANDPAPRPPGPWR
jgi:hypothetical protein